MTATGVFSYVPNANYNGSDSFTFHVNDGMFDSNIATIALTILPVNDPPIAYTTSYMIAGNSYASNGNIFAGTLSGTDIDSSVLTFTSSTLPIHGILSLMNSGSYTYNPAYGYTGSDSFTYLVNDGQGGISNTGVVNFIMSGTNSAPFAATGTYMTNEDTAISFTLSGSDPDGDTISFILDSSVATGTLALQASGTVNFTPTLNFNGTLNFTYHTSDGLLSSPVRTISIDVLPVNDAPSVNSGNFTITGNILSDSGYTAVFTSLVSDVDSSIFSFTLSTLPSNGTVSMTASGIFTYTPNIGYVGVDTF